MEYQEMGRKPSGFWKEMRAMKANNVFLCIFANQKTFEP